MENNSNHRGGVINSSEGVLATIEVDKQTVEKCRQFALARIGLSEALYRARGEERVAKMVEDIVVGCSAEYAVQKYVKDKGNDCSEPDLSIHENGTKSFSADLLSEGKFLHVKAQTVESASKHGMSWIFQKEDSTLTLPSENGYLFLCLVEPGEETYRVYIKAAVWIIDMLEAEAISVPKVWKYQLYKSAIYLEDLVAKNINIKRL